MGRSPLALILLLAVVSPCAVSAQALRIPAVLSDHMVLQRELPVPIWGWAAPGATVEVSFKGQKVRTTADDGGKWRIDLQPMPADARPATLTVDSNDETETIRDVLVGEVWLCSGQSNMEWIVKQTTPEQQELAKRGWPLIRQFKAPRRVAWTPREDTESTWITGRPDKTPWFTAVGFFFALELHRELDVPVGLVNCSWGGTRIEPWIPLESMEGVPALATSHEPGLQLRASPPPEVRPNDQYKPAVLFNGMIRPVAPYGIRGVLWYQGEANYRDGMDYVEKTATQVAAWRELWGRPDLPYYYVQIAPYAYKDEEPTILPTFWEAQAAIEARVPHTAMAVTIDIGDLANIHPVNKKDVGDRLATIALKRLFGRSELLDSGPRFESLATEGDRLLVRFSSAGDGLRTRDGGEVSHFEITGRGEPWTAARAEIVPPDTIALSAEGITRPTAVRFAWSMTAQPNLVNSAGLPATAFRAGEAPRE